MDKTKIKNEVRKHYAEIARQRGCGCAPSCCDKEDTITSLVDYGKSGEDVVEANLGLGCGIPTEHAGIKSGDTVLDLGSGAGVDVFIASKTVGPNGRIIGVDMTQEMLDRARANAAKGGYTNVEFRLGDIEALPLEDTTIDVTISNCVINLAPDKRRVFSEIYRVLKSGGHFTVSDIVTFGNVPEKIRKDVEMWAGCIAGALDQQEYLKIIKETGFKNIRIIDTKNFSYPKENTDYGFSSVTVEGYK